MFFKRRRDTWSLRAGDLPPEAWVVEEPRLRGLADNAVFRMQLHLKRRRSRKVEPRALGLLTREHTAELFQTGIAAEDIAIGLWGAELTGRTKFWSVARWIALGAAGGMLALAAAVDMALGLEREVMFRVAFYAYPALFFVPAYIANERHQPAAELPMRVLAAEAQRRNVARKLRPAEYWKQSFFIFLRTLAVLALVAIVGSVVVAGLVKAMDGYAVLPLDLSRAPAIPLIGAALVAAGAGLGHARGLHARRHREENFRRLVAAVAEMQEMLRTEDAMRKVWGDPKKR